MSLESDLFERLRGDQAHLLAFGFEKNGDEFVYERKICGGSMRAVIRVDENGVLHGGVYDEFDEEYIAYRIEKARGSFAANVRKEYLELLEEIAGKCFRPVPFILSQTNRIADYIAEKYGDQPEHIFEMFPDYCVFRHHEGKWYALLAEVKEGTFADISEKTEVLNVKVKEETLNDLLALKGFYPAFHMNRKSWVSIVMNDEADDSLIESLIDESYRMTDSVSQNLIRSEWIIPANPKYFDLDHAFAVSDLLYWKQSSKVKVGDLIYIYYGMPFGEIRYLCEAVEIDVPYKGLNDGPVHFEKLMRLKKLHFFDGNLLNRKKIAEFGVTNIRGPRYMPSELKKEIIRLYNLEEIENE